MLLSLLIVWFATMTLAFIAGFKQRELWELTKKTIELVKPKEEEVESTIVDMDDVELQVKLEYEERIAALNRDEVSKVVEE